MDMQNYTTPFANTGDREEFSIDTDPQGKVSLEKGWTELYQLRPEEGGLFILRKVFNQMMKLVSTDTVTWKTQSFPNWIDDKGDGLPYAYPKNAIVKYTDGNIYVSKVDNNTSIPTDSNNNWDKIPSIENLALTVDTIDDFPAGATTGDTCIVKDLDRGGIFIYDSTKVSEHNEGTNFNGWIRQFSGAVNVKWFGAKGDSNGTTGTDNTVAIQKALEYCILNKKSLDFGENEGYLISETLLLPVNTVENSYKAPIIINGRGSTIYINSNIPILDSAYYNNGVLTSNISTATETNMSFGVIIENLGFINNFSNNTAYAVRLKDWHQGSIIRDCSIRANAALDMCNCFYSKVLNIITAGTKVTGLSRFRFRSNNNLMEIKGLVAVNSNIGYYFDGLVDAVNFYQNSIEGMDIGVYFNGEVRSINIDSNYIEAVTDTMFKFNSYVFSATINNNYCNFIKHPNCYMIDYVPLPNNNIIIGNGNSYVAMPSDYNFFKTKSNIYGYNAITLSLPPRRSLILDDLYVNNTNFSTQARIDKILHTVGSKAKVVNGYAEGQYAGRFTNGYGSRNGFDWVNTGSNILQLNTKITESDTSRIYVNIKIGAGELYYYAGEFVKYGGTWKFYKFTETGVVVDSTLTISAVNGFLQIGGTMSGVVFEALGEIRLV